MLARAVMDGVAFALAESVGLVAELAGAPGQLRLLRERGTRRRMVPDARRRAGHRGV